MLDTVSVIKPMNALYKLRTKIKQTKTKKKKNVVQTVFWPSGLDPHLKKFLDPSMSPTTFKNSDMLGVVYIFAMIITARTGLGHEN